MRIAVVTLPVSDIDRAIKLPLGVVAVPELKRAPQRADGVVVRFLLPAVRIRHVDQGRVSHAEKGERANGGPPDVIEALAMGGQGRRRQVARGRGGDSPQSVPRVASADNAPHRS